MTFTHTGYSCNCEVRRPVLTGAMLGGGGPRGSQKLLVVQQLGVLSRLPESVETEVEIHLNHLFAFNAEKKPL